MASWSADGEWVTLENTAVNLFHVKFSLLFVGRLAIINQRVQYNNNIPSTKTHFNGKHLTSVLKDNNLQQE